MDKYYLNEKEYQDYCAYKHIEQQIKGCLDRERELEKKLLEKEQEIKPLREQNERVLKKLKLIVDDNQDLRKQLDESKEQLENYKLCKCVNCTNEYEFMLEELVSDMEKQIEELKQSKNQVVIEKLENLKEIINNNAVDFEKGIHIIVTELLIGHIDYQIKILKGENYGKSK